METAIGTALAAAENGRVAGERAARRALAELPSECVDFCQVFSSIEYEYEAVIAGIAAVIGTDPPLIGCSTGEAFTEDEVTRGVVAVGLVASDTVTFFTGLGTGLSDDVPGAVREATADLPTEVTGYPHMAAINLHDGLSSVGEELALVTQKQLGPSVHVAGGAATDDHHLEGTHVFHNETVAEDAVVLGLIASKEQPVVAVEHGHEPLSEPFEVTRSDGSLVYELDGEPAFQVWKDAVRAQVREEFGVTVDDLDPSDQLLQRIMCEFEFGFDQGGRYKMRWPWIETEGGPLHFAVGIPEGTVMCVMHGHPDMQIESGRQTIRSARQRAGDVEMAGAFVYDCACRSIVLEDDLSAAIDAMAEELDMPMVGFETYGEIGMGRKQFSGFHNATTVVLLLPE